MSHHHNHGHRPHDADGHHTHAHAGEPSGIGRLSPATLWTPAIHRLGRRQFLADLGRKTFAVAILGAGAAACSGSGSTATPTAPTSDPAAAPDATAPPPEDDAPTPAPPEEAEPTPEEVVAARLAWAQVSLGSVSAYVLVRGTEAAVVDTGNPGSAAEIGSALSTLGAGWGDVRHVILTHSHGDHVGSLSEVLDETSTATAYAGELDIGNIQSPNPLQAVGDGDDILGLEVINTPGHTPGSISVLDTDIGLLIAGDALNGNADGTEVSGPNPAFSADMNTANASVQRLAELTFETAAFGHGNPVLSGAGKLVADLAAGT